MFKNVDYRLLVQIESTIDELYVLESILKLMRESCQEKDFSLPNSNYSQEQKITLSEERNDYINMLNIALDKIDHIKKELLVNK